EIRQIAEPVASRLTLAVFNAGTEGDDKLANWFLAEELLLAMAPGPVNAETKRYVAMLIYEVLVNPEVMIFRRMLAAVLIRIAGASPTSARVTDFSGAIDAAVQSIFKVKGLFNFEEMEAGRRKYGANGRDLKDFLAFGWQRNLPLMDRSAANNWNLARQLAALKAKPAVATSPQPVTVGKRSEVREAAVSPRVRARRQVILGNKRMMSLFRGPVHEVVRTVFASDFYPRTADLLGLPESSDTVVIVDTIRGTVVWKLAELEGFVALETGRLDAFPPGFKALTPQALFLLDHPELLQRILAKFDPSMDLKMRRARVYDGAFVTQPEADKIYIEEQLKRISVAIAFQVGSENEIGDILRVPGVIPMALRDNGPVDMSKLGFGFDDVRMILDLGKQIKLQTKGAGLPEVLYLNRRAAYLRESNLYLSRLGPLSDLALSNEDVKALMRREGNAYVMTPQAFSALASIVNELAARAEVRKAYEAAA
ncbi:MAG TPA: hypothetical protein VD913_04615, partial [bacterium]|nr:hypothetical protein [bacterium]